jgi:tRNA-specific 2-thiouridylase
MCNKYIKWGAIFDYAIGALKCDFIATGHYAQIKHEDKYYKLFPAFDTLKDQLYFLFLLTQEHLAKTFFPLSNLKKAEVKEIAEKYDLPSKSAKESQDICFIKPPITTKKYLNRIFKEQQGNFIDVSTGKIIGQHNGYWQYTIGQRKGIGIAAPQPLYVIKIEPENNQVFVGDKDTLLINKLTLKNINWSYPQYQKRFKALVKIRYNMPAIESIIEENNGYWEITFNTPVSGIAQGQACVLYDLNDGHLLGGDFI